MRSPIRVLQDWSALKKCKLELLDALKRTPVGAGVTINDMKNPILSRAIIELLKENPQSIEMMDNTMSVTLYRKVTMHSTLSKETYEHQRGKFGILNADGVVALGLEERLPERAWRYGVPDDINGPAEDGTAGGVTVTPDKIIVEK